MDNSNQVIIDGVVKYTRVCPKCGETLYHKTKYSRNNCRKQKKWCKKCVCNEPERIKKYSETRKGENNPMFGKTGDKNPFFGKHHTQESINKANKTKEETGYAAWKTPEYREKQRQNGINNNPMKGRSVYSVWLEKYGKEEADKRMATFKEKQRINNTGSKNAMYGKPSPRGAGNGWKGWYKNIYFRSLRELMVLIDFIDNNKKYINLEKAEYAVQYTDYNGQVRNYFGDYLVDNQWIEIKPLKLQSTIENKVKREAAEKVCLEKGWTFKYIDPVIDSELIKIKYLNGDIKWDKRYEEKIKKYYGMI